MQERTSHFSEKLINCRKEAGLSQTDLAHMLGVKPSAISNYEAGRRIPSLDMIRALGYVLRVSQEELLDALKIDLMATSNKNYLMALAQTPDLGYSSTSADEERQGQPLDKLTVKKSRLKERIVSNLDLFNERGLRNISTFISWLIEADKLKKNS